MVREHRSAWRRARRVAERVLGTSARLAPGSSPVHEGLSTFLPRGAPFAGGRQQENVWLTEVGSAHSWKPPRAAGNNGS